VSDGAGATGARPSGEMRAPRAAIHDLGYKRYVGTRRPQSTRWRVIVKNLVATSWRGWWRMKLWIIGAAITTVGIGVPMYIFRNQMFEALMRHGQAMKFADALLPIGFRFFNWFGFILGATVAASQVARDTRAGAFEFYFSRPVRPIDYVLGKVGGTALVMALAIAAGPFLLSLFRVGLSLTSAERVATLEVIPKVLLVGGLASLAYAAVPLAISTLSSRTRITISVWVAFYILFGFIVQGLAFGLRIPSLAALDLSTAVMGTALGLFDVHVPLFRLMPGLAVSMAALVGYIALGIAVLVVRVRLAQRAGLGGG
jgi:ABC-2 type transport system permease protein